VVGKSMRDHLPAFALHEKGADYLIYSSPRPPGRTGFIIFNYHSKKDWFSVECALNGSREFPWRAESVRPSSPLGVSGMRFPLLEEGKKWVKQWKITGYDSPGDPPGSPVQNEPASASEDEIARIGALVGEAVSRIRQEFLTTVEEIEKR